MGRLMNIYIEKLADYLASEGERLAKQALETKQTRNRSFNQQDAFGYVVYYKRAVKRKGYANASTSSTGTHKGWSAIDVPAGTGREWIDGFIDTWKPKSNGVVLIVVNAAFYSMIQEQGSKNSRTTYQIISQIFGDMESVSKNFKGSKVSIKTGQTK